MVVIPQGIPNIVYYTWPRSSLVSTPILDKDVYSPSSLSLTPQQFVLLYSFLLTLVSRLIARSRSIKAPGATITSRVYYENLLASFVSSQSMASSRLQAKKWARKKITKLSSFTTCAPRYYCRNYTLSRLSYPQRHTTISVSTKTFRSWRIFTPKSIFRISRWNIDTKKKTFIFTTRWWIYKLVKITTHVPNV